MVASLGPASWSEEMIPKMIQVSGGEQLSLHLRLAPTSSG